MSKELVDLLLSDKDASVLIELLEDYESLRIADWTESLDFDARPSLQNFI